MTPASRCEQLSAAQWAADALPLPAVADDGTPPEWVQLFPATTELAARDGRHWTLDAAAVVAETQRQDSEPPVDINHATETRAREGEPTPAAGWIKELAVRDGAVWARIDWTAMGAGAVTRREYRYLSPAFLHSGGEERRVKRITSVALTCLPALDLPALNQEQPMKGNDDTKKGGEQPTGTAAAADEKPIAAAADLATMVPRADYDHAMARAAKAEADLAADRKAREDATIDETVRQAVADGKIAPASVDYHKAACAAEGGLERFRAMCAAAPSITAPTGADAKPSKDAPRALTAEERQVAAAFGLPEDKFREAL